MQIRSQQAHPTVDVEAHSTGRNDRQRIASIESGHIPDGKTVPGVDIGQTHRTAHNSGQCGHIGDLLDAGQESPDPIAASDGIPQLFEH